MSDKARFRIDLLKKAFRDFGVTQDEIKKDASRVKSGMPCFMDPDVLLCAQREYWSELEAERTALIRGTM